MPQPFEQSQSTVVAQDLSVKPEEIPQVLEELRAAFRSDKTQGREWRLGQLHALQRLLTEGRDELCEAMHQDLHKSHFEGYLTEINLIEQEIYDAITNIDEWMADERVATNLFNFPSSSMVQKDPLGVVLVMGAWNYNVMLTLHPMVGAIAAGNCVVIKPGSYAAHSSNVMARLIPKYLDSKCIRVCEGNRHVTSALLEQKFDMIFFTGSTYVGKIVAEAAAKQLCPVVLELGGKSPCIVDDSADLYVSARRTAWGALLNAGQTCVRPDYLMLHENIADKFIAEMKTTIAEFYGGDPKASQWFGRIINKSNHQRLSKVIEDGKDFIVHGGTVDPSDGYIEPTILHYGSDWRAFANSEAMQEGQERIFSSNIHRKLYQ